MDNFTRIYKWTKAMYAISQNILKLDLENQLQSVEYERQRKYYEMCQEELENIYQQLSPDELESIPDLIFDDINPQINEAYMDDILDEKSIDPILIRILNQVDSHLPLELIEIDDAAYNLLGDESIQNTLVFLAQEQQLNSAIMDHVYGDIIDNFCINLQKQLDNPVNLEFNEKICTIKHLLGFIDPQLETTILAQKHQPHDKIDYTFLNAKKVNLDEEVYEEILSQMKRNAINDRIAEMQMANPLDRSEFSIFLFQIYLESMLQLLDASDIDYKISTINLKPKAIKKMTFGEIICLKSLLKIQQEKNPGVLFKKKLKKELFK